MLKFLGSGGAFNVDRGNNAAFFELGTELFLFDIGEDVFQKIIKNNLLEKKTRVNIFITHLHSDHVGSLGTLISYLYLVKFNQDMSKICVYFPSDVICDFLRLQGVPKKWYNLFINRWDELWIDGFQKKPEYVFIPVSHTMSLDSNEDTNTFAIEIMLEDEFSFYFSGDTNSFDERLLNIWNYDYIFHEVTMIPDSEYHFSYDRLLDATKSFSEEDKQKIYLMHLDHDFDVEVAKKDGFRVVENI